MAYNKEIVEQVILELAKGKKVKEIKGVYNVSEATIYRWKKKYMDESKIRTENVKILKGTKELKQERLGETLKLSSDPRFQDNLPIQSQRLTILIKQGKLNEALALSNDPRFQNDFLIQSQRLTILMKQGKLDEALALSSEPRFQDYFVIQTQKEKIKRMLAIKNVDPMFLNKNLNNEIDNLLKRVYQAETEHYSQIIETILNSSVKEWQKVVLTIALYEKIEYPLTAIIKYLKNKMIIYNQNAEVIKIVKTLLRRVSSRPNIFDLEFYKNILLMKINDSIEKERQHLLDLKENISPSKRQLTF